MEDGIYGCKQGNPPRQQARRQTNATQQTKYRYRYSTLRTRILHPKNPTTLEYPLQRTLHIYRKQIYNLYIYSTHIAKADHTNFHSPQYVPPPTRKKVLLDTYKHALALSLSVLTSFKVRVCRTVVRFYLFGFDWRIKFLHSHSKSHTGSLPINFVVTKSKTTSTVAPLSLLNNNKNFLNSHTTYNVHEYHPSLYIYFIYIYSNNQQQTHLSSCLLPPVIVKMMNHHPRGNVQH